MNVTLRIRSKVLLAAASLVVLAACVAGPGYDGGTTVAVAYGVGYYEPHGYVYGGYPSHYHVAPPPVNHDRDAWVRASHEGNRSYRPAPQGRPAPSLPSRPRPH
jgi:hypothetical protein